MDVNNRKEIDEAIAAGERALASLKDAKEKLNSAGNWGMFDILGGGMFTDMIKHSKIGNAKTCLEQAKRDLMVFRKEMSDVEGELEVQLNLGDFLVFADFFFDGLIADCLVHSKIKEAGNQTETAIIRVEQIVLRLRQLRM